MTAGQARLARGIAAAVLLVQVSAVFAPAQDDALFPRTVSIVEDAIAGGTVSATLGYARDGEIVWTRSWGFAGREHGVQATPDTMYSLASISKPFTATGIMLLVDRGRIDLDAPVNDYLGHNKLRARRGLAENATVRRLANHTSGLPLHYQFFYEDEGRPVPSRDETIRRYGNLITAPGERVQYSNLAFGVLDHVISRVSGKPYSEFMRDEVLEPLGIERCAVGVPDELDDHDAVRYGRDDEPIPFYDFDHPGASAVYCSARDLLRFGMFHLGSELDGVTPILGRERLVEMRERADPISDYGVGWGVREVDGVVRVSHSGGMGGVSTTLTLLPKQNAAFVVLFNSSGPLMETLNMFLHEAFPRRIKEPDPRAPREEERTSFLPPETLVGTWAGHVATYGGDVGLELQIRDGGDMLVRFEGQRGWRRVREPSLDDGRLRARFDGALPTEDVMRDQRTLGLAVTLRGDVLDGALTAFTKGDLNKVGNALTHWVQLTRKPVG